MLISFAYATQSALRIEGGDEQVRTWGRFWYTHVSAAFLRGYWRVAEQLMFMPRLQTQQQTLIDAFMMERALLDIRADIEDKPDFAGVPFRVILHLLGEL
jgi:maltose alpha-D-glucosyltransferase/alpha-amylase